MNQKINSIAYKYAQAYLSLHNTLLDESSFRMINTALNILVINRHSLIAFDCAFSLGASAQKLSHDILHHFSLPIFLTPLLSLLLYHKRLVLLPEVLKYLLDLYQTLNNVEFFHVTSTIPLTDAECLTITTFLHAKIGKQIWLSYAIDKQLIAGIRIKSNQWLWEFSIKNTLSTIEQSLNSNSESMYRYGY